MGKFDESFSWIERLIPCLVIFLITTRVIVIRPGRMVRNGALRV